MACYVELRPSGGSPVHGVGLDSDADTATVQAVLGATNRLASALSERPRASAVL